MGECPEDDRPSSSPLKLDSSDPEFGSMRSSELPLLFSGKVNKERFDTNECGLLLKEKIGL